MRRFLLLSLTALAMVAMVIGDANMQTMTAPSDTVILIKPEEMRVMPKSLLERKLGFHADQAGAPAAILPAKTAEKLEKKLTTSEKEETTEEKKQKLLDSERRFYQSDQSRLSEQDSKRREESSKSHAEETKRREETSKSHADESKRRDESSKSHAKDEKKDKKPEDSFKDGYVAVGTVRLIFDNTSEPFTLFYDGVEKRSRVDLGTRGLVRSLQLSKLDRMFRIEFPSETNKKAVCIEMKGTRDKPVKVLKAFPDFDRFERVSEEDINEKRVDKWRFKRLDEKDLKTHHTFWLFTEKETRKPVRIEVFTKSKRTQKLVDHYIVDFKYFFPTRPSNDIFDKPKEVECRSIVGLSIKEEEKHEERKEERQIVEGERLQMNPLAVLLDPELHAEYEREITKFFESFKKVYDKKYESEDETEMRLAAFCHNVRYVKLLNREGLSFKLRLNHLTDRTNDELRKMLGVRGVGKLPSEAHMTKFDSKTHNVRGIDRLPESIDWRILNGVTHISDQKTCGSDWAIAATSVIESAYYLRTNKNIKLSAQQLLDCSHEKTCESGNTWQAYEFALKNGLSPEFFYGRLRNKKEECKRDTLISAKIKNWVLVDKDEVELKRAIAMNGPVAALIDAAHKSFFFYASGIYHERSCHESSNDVNHAIVLVGYGKLNGRDYFLLQNSFSTEWGLNGYMLIDAHGNQCGILSAPTFVDM